MVEHGGGGGAGDDDVPGEIRVVAMIAISLFVVYCFGKILKIHLRTDFDDSARRLFDTVHVLYTSYLLPTSFYL
jgi:hypothetical protein